MKVKCALLTALGGLAFFFEELLPFLQKTRNFDGIRASPYYVLIASGEEGSKGWHPGNSVTIFSKCPLLFKMFCFYMQNNRAKCVKINIFSCFRKQKTFWITEQLYQISEKNPTCTGVLMCRKSTTGILINDVATAQVSKKKKNKKPHN